MKGRVLPRYSGVCEQFGIKDGLPDMKVECLFEDRQGTLWIGTHARGVAMYNSDRFQSYTVRDGLSGNAVYSIQETAHGDVLLATGSGLCSWSCGTGQIVGPDVTMPLLWGGQGDGSGVFWFGLARQQDMPARVCRTDGATVEALQLEEQGTSLGRSVNSVVIDDEGRVWCGGHGLFVVCDGVATSVLPDRAELAYINAMCMSDGEGLIVAGTGGTYALSEGQIYAIGGREAQIEGMCRSRSGAVWCTTREGSLLRYRDREFEEVRNLGVPLWRAVVEDQVGRVWLGTYGFGLLCYDESRVRVMDTGHGLPDNRVQALAWHGERVWIATPKGLATDAGDIEADVWRGSDAIISRDVTGLLADTRRRLWIGKRNGSIYVLEGGDLTLSPRLEEMRHYRVDRFVEDADGAVWAASSIGGGVARYSSPHECQAAESLGGGFPSHVGAMAAGRHGSVFFGSLDPHECDGVVEYRGGCVQRVEGFGGSPVTALCVDDDERLWIGTTEGLWAIDGEFVLSFGLQDGLTSELVTCLALDAQRRIWIGTEGGGVCVTDGTVIQSLQLADRPFCNTVNCICEQPTGKIWFGTNGGLVQRRMSRAVVTAEMGVVVADSEYACPKDIQVPDTVNRLTFAYRGTSSIDRSAHLVFRLRLEGYESEWRQTRELKVDYPRLSPRGYEFSVQAVDRDLNYSDPVLVRVAVVADPRIDALNQALRSEGVRGEFVGESHAMCEVMQQVAEVSWTDLTVLVLGETGTGKGLAARRIHELSERRDGPLIHVNCGSMQGGLIDSELFGHERGAFTGAVSRRLGKFELAHGGTVFLDEIGDLPLESQARLLKVLQDRTIERVGGTHSISVDVRVIAATNRDLSQAVRDHAYRADLYYRLNVFPIRMPPLRERREDTLALARHFMSAFAAHLNQVTPDLTTDAAVALLSYDWPGNVRELEHTLQRAVLLAKGDKVGVEHLGIGFAERAVSVEDAPIVSLAEFERRYFTRVLSHTGGVIHGQHGAARLLDMKPTTLRSRLEKLGIRTRRSRR